MARPRFTLPVFVGVTLLGLLWGLGVVALTHSSVLARLELYSYDWRVLQTLGQPAPRPVTIVVVDTETERNLTEPTMLWDPYYAAAIQAALRAGAKAVVLDIIPSINVEETLRHVLPAGTRIPPQDSLLASAVHDAPVFISSFFNGKTLVRPVDPIYWSAGPTHVGQVNREIDVDGIVRRFHLVDADAAASMSPMLPALLARHLGTAIDSHPVDADGDYLIRFYGPHGRLPSCSLSTVLAAARRGDAAYLADAFKDHLVYIGTSSPDFNDLHPSPLGLGQAMVPGVEILADATLTLLDPAAPRRVAPRGQATATVMLAALFALLAFVCRPLYGGLCLSLFLTALIAFALHLFREGWWLNLAAPVVAVAGAAALATVYRQITTEAERRRVRDVLARCVSPTVATELLRRPEKLELGGTMQELTVLFSDINGFTAMTERLGAAETMRLLNEYYTLMEPIAFRWGGAINKYVGDELMILFGAPVASCRHALDAVYCALEMQTAILEWNERRTGLEPMGVKFGINTGHAVVGLMGSLRRLEYTSIGESINLAARLMGLTQRLGAVVLVGPATAAKVADEIPCIPHGEHLIRGMVEPVPVYELPPPVPNRKGGETS